MNGGYDVNVRQLAADGVGVVGRVSRIRASPHRWVVLADDGPGHRDVRDGHDANEDLGS
jgi:hypothetical protein